MGATINHANGKLFDSKSALRASYRAHGVREVGTAERRPLDLPKPNRKAIEKSLKQALQTHAWT